MTINVMIVDDHVLLLESLKNILDNDTDIHVTSTISDPSFLKQKITSHYPDIVVMDIRIKSYNGLELTKNILEFMPQLSVIILSGYDSEEYIEAAYRIGASAFVSKDKSNEILLTTIKQVHLGYKIFPKTNVDRKDEMLTPKELEVLSLIAKDKSNKEISSELFVSKRTVEHHISSIISKLEVDSRVGAVVTAIKKGLLTIN
ncbi:DNA-binding NarL/FixJ family response regulator [Sporosarcina luteola]|nr:DNA-binding NarL/FixJ family response regulator [Sporosarcina luteola]